MNLGDTCQHYNATVLRHFASMRKTAGDIQLAIEKLALEEPRLGPAQILGMLQRDRHFRRRTDLPEIRTVQRIVKDVRVPDTSGPWQFGDSPADVQDVILDTLAALVTWTEGRVQELTADEAETLAQLAPRTRTMDARQRWRLAQLYRLRRARDASTADLDQFLAFAPWADNEHRQRYERALKLGHVPRSPAMLYGDLEGLTYGDIERQHMTYADLEGRFNIDETR